MNKYLHAYAAMWQNFSDFTGRSDRGAYWRVVVINILIGLVFGILSEISGIFQWVASLYALAALIPGIALSVRRLHDVGKSGPYLLFALIPLVGWVIVLIPMIQEGDSGENRYGSAPA